MHVIAHTHSVVGMKIALRIRVQQSLKGEIDGKSGGLGDIKRELENLKNKAGGLGLPPLAILRVTSCRVMPVSLAKRHASLFTCRRWCGGSERC